LKTKQERPQRRLLGGESNNNNNNNLFNQRLTNRRLVYNGITQVWEVLEWRQSAANRKVQPAGSLQSMVNGVGLYLRHC